MTFDLPIDVARELRVAVASLPPKAIGGSISSLVVRALEAELERLRKAHNAGEPFESDDEPTVPRGPARRG